MILQRLELLGRRFHVSAGDDDEAAEVRASAATAAARRGGGVDAQELANAMLEALAIDGVEPRPVHASPSLRGRTALLQALASGSEELVIEDMVDAIASFGGTAEELNQSRLQDELSGRRTWYELIEATSLAHVNELARTVPADLLRRDVLGVASVRAMHWMFLLYVVPFNPARGALLREIMDDPMWQVVRQLPPPTGSRFSQLAVAANAAVLAHHPALLAETERYAARLQEILKASLDAGHLPP